MAEWFCVKCGFDKDDCECDSPLLKLASGRKSEWHCICCGAYFESSKVEDEDCSCPECMGRAEFIQEMY